MFIPLKIKNTLFALLVAIPLLVHATDWKPAFKEKKIVTDQEKQQMFEAMPTVPIVGTKAKRKVLIYSATAGARHWAIPVGKFALKELGKNSSAYEAIVSDDPDNFEAEKLKIFDAVLLLNTTGNFFMPCTRGEDSIRDQFSDEEWNTLEQRDKRLMGNLIQYVRNGGGLVGIHAATDAYYGNWEYRNMIGGTFWGHPWTAQEDVTIVVEDPEHGINRLVFGSISHFGFKEEIYQMNKPYSRDRLKVLLRLDPERSDTPHKEPKRDDGDFAVSWIREEGKGRVFYTSIGHNYEHYWNPIILNHYLAGIQFATGDLEADMTPSGVFQDQQN